MGTIHLPICRGAKNNAAAVGMRGPFISLVQNVRLLYRVVSMIVLIVFVSTGITHGLYIECDDCPCSFPTIHVRQGTSFKSGPLSMILKGVQSC